MDAVYQPISPERVEEMTAPRKQRLLYGAVVLLFLLACGFPLQPWSAPTATQTAVAASLTPEKGGVSQAVPSETPGEPFTGACAWTWANQELPDLTQELANTFAQAGMGIVEVRAAAFGENCVDAQANKVVRFAAMQTDFYLTIPVEDTADRQAAGEWIVKVIKILEPYVPGKVPGPNPGYIGIRFVAPEGEVNLWFQRVEAEELVKSGKTGSELYDALHKTAE